MKAFITIPWSIYRHDPNWVPPLKFERKEAFSEKNPFFEHARWEAWLAYRGGVPIGRISAQIDSLYLERHDARTGFFGLIEAPDDAEVFAALFAAAETWLKKQEMTSALGPFNLGINQEIGCLVEGFDSPPYVMMGHARPYYGQQIEKRGYSKAQDVLCYEMNRDSFALPQIVQRLLKRLEKKIRVRTIDRRNAAADLETMCRIFNDAWSDNWGFVPFTSNEFSTLGKELLMVVPADFIHIADLDGKPAAFIVLIPNLNEVIADLDGRLFPFAWARLLWRLKVRFPKSGRIALMGVRREFQHTRMGPALAFSVMRALHGPIIARGLNRVEASWILEQNRGMRNIMEQVGGFVTKRYRIYQKSLLGNTGGS
jgi:hypothetical protein